MESTWVGTLKPKGYPQLEGPISVDAAIIGGGITGTTAAYLLAKKGVRVALIDKGILADSVSAYTTAFIRYVVDDRLMQLKDLFGDEYAKSIWLSSKEATDLIRKSVQEERIDCEYRPCAFYKYANNEEEWEEISKDAELAKGYGFPVEKRQDDQLPMPNCGYMVVPDQAKFHPLKYLDALRAKAVAAGALICERTEAQVISGEDTYTIHTSHGLVNADRVLIATYDPFNRPHELLFHRGTYTTYVLELQIPKDSLSEAMYEDNENPYHYLRIDKGGEYDRAILGGEDHRHELPLDSRKAFGALEEYFKRIFPSIRYTVKRTWTGPILETVDGLPFIGAYDEDRPGLFVATGYSGSGMTFGTLAARMFTEFAMGQEVPWKGLYDPRRKVSTRKLWEKFKDYGGEFMNAYVKNVVRSPDGGEKSSGPDRDRD